MDNDTDVKITRGTEDRSMTWSGLILIHVHMHARTHYYYFSQLNLQPQYSSFKGKETVSYCLYMQSHWALQSDLHVEVLNEIHMITYTHNTHSETQLSTID